MSGDAPATTMTGTGGRWAYANGPTAVSGGVWFLVLEPATGEYPHPVFFWEVACVPGGPQPASCFPSTVTTSATPTAPSGPTLACSPVDPAVGATVTCELTGAAPDIDILWRATAGGTAFASTGVRTTSDGMGTFSFVVPTSALGLPIAVELVDWTRPLDVGVAGGPVPSAVNAGEGMPTPPAILLLVALLGVALATSGLLVLRMRSTA
jgi:hypothetical protein